MRGIRCGAIQQEGPMCLQIRAVGKQAKPDFILFVYIFMLQLQEYVITWMTSVMMQAVLSATASQCHYIMSLVLLLCLAITAY
jgi:hypothetical protein